MFVLALLFICVFGYSNYDANPSYPADYPAGDSPTEMANILYDRSKCTTCCRVLFASDYNFAKKRQFQDGDTDTRYVMDMEFDKLDQVRQASTDWEQCILLRPISLGRELQFFEFAPYKMYISYPLPKRVHDIRRGSSSGHKLIIWAKKPPLDPDTNNQRFVYVHPYSDEIYSTTKDVWKKYPKHFYIPFYTGGSLCYQAVDDGASSKTTTQDKVNVFQTWEGNSGLKYSSKLVFQITANTCSNTDAKQFPVVIMSLGHYVIKDSELSFSP